MLTAVLTLGDQVSGGPSGVADQSLARMRAPISPPPASHAGASAIGIRFNRDCFGRPNHSDMLVFRDDLSQIPNVIVAADNYVILRIGGWAST